MTYFPSIVSARDVRSFSLGDYTARLLTDVVSGGLIEYHHVLLVHEAGEDGPILAVASEYSLAADPDNPCLGVFHQGGHISLGASPAYLSLELFEKAAVEAALKQLKIPKSVWASVEKTGRQPVGSYKTAGSDGMSKLMGCLALLAVPVGIGVFLGILNYKDQDSGSTADRSWQSPVSNKPPVDSGSTDWDPIPQSSTPPPPLVRPTAPRNPVVSHRSELFQSRLAFERRAASFLMDRKWGVFVGKEIAGDATVLQARLNLSLEEAVHQALERFREMRPSNGQEFVFTRYERIAPLTVVTRIEGNGIADYYVKLERLGAAAPEVGLYIRGGQRATTKVPLGTYRIKYAVVRNWYGSSRFGPYSSFSKADSTFTFERIGGQISGYTIELILRVNGNLRTESIPPTSF